MKSELTPTVRDIGKAVIYIPGLEPGILKALIGRSAVIQVPGTKKMIATDVRTLQVTSKTLSERRLDRRRMRPRTKDSTRIKDSTEDSVGTKDST